MSKRRGFYRNKSFNVQRFECLKCGTTFSEKLPLDNLRVDFKLACQVANMLCEGIGIRAISRLTRLHQQTVLNILARAGSKCARFLDRKVRNVKPESVQADEMFCYVGCKERNNTFGDPFRGDQYLFMAMDSGSKLIISHAIGKRSSEKTHEILNDLKTRVTGRMQITTDGFPAYKVAMPRTIGKDVDFAQLIKIFSVPADNEQRGERRYSPGKCVSIRKVIRRGNPNPDHISTSYIERTNLSVRLFNRRFTRLTLGYSKKFEYLTHSINLFVAHYNFVKKHITIGMTPARAAGLTDTDMNIEQILLTPD